MKEGKAFSYRPETYRSGAALRHLDQPVENHGARGIWQKWAKCRPHAVLSHWLDGVQEEDGRGTHIHMWHFPNCVWHNIFTLHFNSLQCGFASFPSDVHTHTYTHIFTYNSFHKYLLSFSSHLYSMIQIIWFQFPFSSLDAIIFSLSVLFTSNISRVNLGHFIQSVQIAYKLSIVSPLGKPVAFTHHVAYCRIFESYHSKLRQNSNIIWVLSIKKKELTSLPLYITYIFCLNMWIFFLNPWNANVFSVYIYG